jgi:hypothetical protein
MAHRERAAVHAWLDLLGYTVAFREQGWTECLVLRPGEQWLGRGMGDADALADAVGRMLPSHAARAGVPDAVLRALRLGDAAPVEIVEALPHLWTADVQPADVLPTPPVIDPPAPAFDAPAPPAPSVDVRPSPQPEPAGDPVRQPPVVDPPTPAAVKRPPERLLGVEESLEALEPLRDRIAAERAELGLAAPHRQRLVILSWICRARAVEIASGEAPLVTDRVAGIAKELSLLTRLWWPGSVTGLQLYATPGEVNRELGLPPGQPPLQTWTDAADAAEQALARIVDRELAAGRDEYGWADGTALLPVPGNPAAELRELRARLEKAVGPIDEPPPKTLPINLQRPGPKDVATFVQLGRLARWLRGGVVDFDTWSRIAGRLRWLAGRMQKAGDPLAQCLDPATRPPTTWAATLGRDPEAQKRKRERLELYRRLATLDANDSQAVRICLADGLRLLAPEALARAMRPFRDVLLAIDPDELVDNNRAERRRLRKLHAVLEFGSGSPVVDADTDDAADVDLAAPTVEESATIDPIVELFQRVRLHTAGRRAAFISNRNDPELASMLHEALGFAEIDWCEGTPRRVQDITIRIGQGAFDYVLAATGFQSHSVDGKLYDACKRAKVPYVRVNKGRPVACAAAILRRMSPA